MPTTPTGAPTPAGPSAPTPHAAGASLPAALSPAALLEEMPAPAAILLAPDGRYAQANAAWRALFGGRDLAGLAVREAHPELAGLGIFERLDRAFAEGRPFAGRGMPVALDRTGTGDRAPGHFDFALKPLAGPDGRVEAVLAVAADVTDHVRARARAERAAGRVARLQAVTAALAEADTPDAVAAVAVAQGLAALGADAGALYFAEPGALRLAGAAGYDADLVRRYARVPLADPTPASWAARAGEPAWVEDAGAVDARFPTLHATRVEAGLAAAAAVPLVLDGAVTGVLTLGFRAARAFGADDRALADAIAGQCAQALRRARALDAEHAALEAERAARADGARSEAATRAAEERYRTFLALSAEGVWRFEIDEPVSVTRPAAEQVEAFYRDGYLAECNAAFAAMYGFERPEDLNGTRLADLTPASDPRNVAYLTAWVESGYRLTGVESHEFARDGTPLVFENSITGHVEAGRLVRAWGTQRDVTARRRADEALRESEARFRDMADSIPQLAWMAGPDGAIHWYNDRWYAYTGTTLDEMQGWGWRAVHHPGHVEGVTERFKLRVAAGEPWEDTFPLRGRDGAFRWFLSRARPIRDADGAVVRWFGTNTDVTEQRELEGALRELNATLEARVAERTAELEGANGLLALKNRELQDFAHVAGHDLQEPLRKIRAFADFLAHDETSRLSDDGRRYVERMHDAAERMSTLIQDLLAYSRVTTATPPEEHVDLNATLHAVLSDLEVRLRETGGRVEAAPLPVVMADATGMHQLFLNLVGNGLKFHRPGVPPVVTVRASEAEPHAVRIEVEDNGIGFDDKYAERIFAPFQRLHGRSEYEGSGVGLAIVRRIAERHGGTVAAEGTPGAGSRFTVTLRPHADARVRGVA